MNLEPIKEYIKQQQQLGVPTDTIHGTLTQTGWPADAVDQAFAEVSGQQAATAPAAPSASPTQPQAQFQPQPQQTNPIGTTGKQKRYGVFKAIGDSFRAAGANAGTLVISTIIGVLASGLLSFSSVAVFGALGLGAFGLTGFFGGGFSANSALVSVLIGIFALYLIQTLSYTVVAVTVSRPLFDGAEGRRSTIKDSLVGSFGQLGRAFLSTMLMYAAIFGPTIIIVIIGFLLAISNPEIGALISIPILIALVWALVAAFRYALVPYIILFEPDLPIRQSLKRSKYLLNASGQWFIFKAIVIMVLIVIIASAFGAAVTGSFMQQTTESSLASEILNIFSLVIFHGIMVMLYRHQAGQQTAPISSPAQQSPLGPIQQS